MYWPTSAARILDTPAPLGRDPTTHIVPNKRGNLFVALSPAAIGVWNVRVRLPFPAVADFSQPYFKPR